MSVGKLIAQQAEYQALLHAVQSGVKALMEHPSGASAAGTRETDPKHLRTGVNSALCSNGALVSLLIKKGVFTEEEYMDELIEFMKRDVASYERKLTILLGRPVTLG